MKRVLSIIFLLVVSAPLSGCIVLPAIEGFSQLGLSKADREKLLPKVLKDFHSALFWSDPVSAAQFIKPESREREIEELRKGLEGVRVVESKVGSIKYNEDSSAAEVRVVVKSYKVPFYVVEDHTYDQKWEFSVSDGWQYVSQSKVKK